MTDAKQLTIHSSWKGIITSFGGGGLTLLVGVLAVSANGIRFLPMIILSAGVMLAVGLLFDFPIAATFDRDGVVRRALLRRHWLRWQQVDQLTRTRPSIFAMRRQVVQGGLTAVVGKRRYLLTDSVESLAEHETLTRLLDAHEIAVDGLLRPPDDVAPSWLYRRQKWGPEPDA